MNDELNEVAKVFLTEVAKAALKKLVSAVQKKDGPISPDLVETRLRLSAASIGCVKTLLSTERAIPIAEFYCSPRVSTGAKIFFPKYSDSFREDHVLVEGIAGQGKSTLLRYLCADSIVNHGRIAFFYELRKLDHKKPLIRIILDSLTDLGLGSKQETLKKLTIERGVEIYLDGYDELSQKEAVKVDRDISDIVTSYPFARLFVSARPHAGLGFNSQVTTYKIEPLNKGDAYRIVDKLLQTQPEVVAEIKKKLDHHSGGIAALLETPLLVTLLVARYSQTRDIPEQLTDFYRSIFDTLFERHDHFKAPFKRTRRLQLNSHQYLTAFQKFSFGSLLAQQLDNVTCINIAEWAGGEKLQKGEGLSFLSDIANTTSLISYDDYTWSFIHSSIQEYYAACELLSLTDSEISTHASKLSSIKNRGSRDQVFLFAEEIDSYRYLSFISLPYFKEALHPLDAATPPDASGAMIWLSANAKQLRLNNQGDREGKFITIFTYRDDMKAVQVFVRNVDYDRNREALGDGSEVLDGLQALMTISYVRDRIVSETLKYLDPMFQRYEQELTKHKKLDSQRGRSMPELMSILGTLGSGATR